jgi:hypothetical protein
MPPGTCVSILSALLLGCGDNGEWLLSDCTPTKPKSLPCALDRKKIIDPSLDGHGLFLNFIY